MNSAFQAVITNQGYRAMPVKEQTAIMSYGYSLTSGKIKSLQSTMLTIAKITNIPKDIGAI